MKWSKKQAIDLLWKFGELKEQIVDDENLTGLRQAGDITEFRFEFERGKPVTYWAVDLSQDTSADAEKSAKDQVQKLAPNARLQFIKLDEERGKTLALVRTFPRSRLDILVAERFSLTRAAAKGKIEAGLVRVAGETVEKPSREYDNDIEITLIPERKPASTLDLPILYQDEDVIVIDKPSGILSHSKGEQNDEETVATWLAAQAGDAVPEQINLPSPMGDRRGIVHRLDRGTSGVMILAKNPVAEKFLQKQFAERKAKKTYLAIVEGEPKQAEVLLDLPIARNFRRPTTFLVSANGKPAQTQLRLLKVAPMKAYSLLELKPRTGRTHQLRVHLAYLNHPILGDTTYGGRKAPRIMLHASELEITLPNSERRTFKSKTPAEFNKYV
ncbi:MAG: RluA family pseudouridine synthase [Candidatus Nomurabacteria bacterium]|jgi:23S rRNA pseudouridine1911/1915/1917 synthase|nr:RluA family pseudouridine synthase [Candidatus Nomurabacteria bacterium]